MAQLGCAYRFRRSFRSEPRTLSIQLASNGKLYVPGENPKAIVSGVKGRGLVVFNIASDAEIQMQFPAAPGFSGACAGIDGDSWSCGMDVTPPFGTDTLVGVSTAKEPAELLAWLRAHHGKRDAADLPQVLEKLVKSDSTTRIGTVGLYTGSGR